MGLIKSPDVPVSAKAFSMQDVENVAKSVLLKAKLKAEQTVAAARAEGDQIKEESRKAGHAEGMERGRAEGFEAGKKSGHAQALSENSAAMTQLIQSLTQAVRDLEEHRDQLQTNGVIEVVRLACAIARKVTKRHGAIDERVLCENLKEAMAFAVHAADVRVAVHPSQLRTLKNELPALRLAWPQVAHVELAEDASISPGGVRIITRHGKIDGDLDAQLDQIISELLPRESAEAL